MRSLPFALVYAGLMALPAFPRQVKETDSVATKDAHAGDRCHTAFRNKGEHAGDYEECGPLRALLIVAAATLTLVGIGFGLHQVLSAPDGWVADAAQQLSDMQQAQLVSVADER